MPGRDPHSTAALLGFLLREREQPVPLLETGPGMTVLYGLNGAGKSRILADVENFFGGVTSDTLALIRLPSVHPGIDWNRETDRGDWFPDWARRADMSFGDHDDILRSWAAASLSAGPVTIPGIPDSSRVHHKNRLEALIEEWLRHPLILVKAVGTAQRRGWASAPAFQTGPMASVTNDEVELYETWDQVDWRVHDGLSEILLTPYGHDRNGAVIACASQAGQSVLEEDAIPFSAGIHDRLLDVSPGVKPTRVDIDERTRSHLVNTVADPVQIVDGAAEPSSDLVEHVARLATAANDHFGAVLRDAPRLRLHVDPIGLGHRVRWFVEEDDRWEDPESRRSATAVSADRLEWGRTLQGLSTAQHKWATWSIDMALSDASSSSSHNPDPDPEAAAPRLYLLDEPEAALHRSAESHMARYLVELARDPANHVLLATHSPELLETESARVYEVSRESEGWRSLKVLAAADRDNMEALGLQPADLLRRQRGLILVEGLHDEVVLDELFSDQMRRLRVETLPLRGTSELSPAKIAFLYRYTPAHLFVMLDNVQTDDLTDAWNRAVASHDAGDSSAARDSLAAAPSLAATDEGKKLRKVLEEVLLNDHAKRLTPFGLSLGDIVEYLPVESFVAAGRSWSELRGDHAERRGAAPDKTPKDFKKWLEKEHDADFDAVSEAARRLDTVPPDLLRLWKTVEAHLSS